MPRHIQILGLHQHAGVLIRKVENPPFGETINFVLFNHPALVINILIRAFHDRQVNEQFVGCLGRRLQNQWPVHFCAEVDVGNRFETQDDVGKEE